jgi:hypothetical protein
MSTMPLSPEDERALARKLIQRLLQCNFIEDHGERDASGNTIWHLTEDGAHLREGAELLAALRVLGTRKPRDDQIGEFILGGLLELDAAYRWKLTELGAVVLRLPGVLAPPDPVSTTLH